MIRNMQAWKRYIPWEVTKLRTTFWFYTVLSEISAGRKERFQHLVVVCISVSWSGRPSSGRLVGVLD